MAVFVAAYLFGPPLRGADFLGFDVSNATIPTSEILRGGPPRDGIPSIDRPKFMRPDEARFMRNGDLVVSLRVGEETRAYPLRILVWHEIVNDTIGGKPVAVTYCPLCGTAMVFDREVAGRTLTFGVSGLLYQSDVLMYDRQTGSLWSQLGVAAVSGPYVGAKLSWIAAEHMTWKAWKASHPEGRVLSTDTGFRRDYGSAPYTDYENSAQIMFPVPSHRKELPSKEWVAGLVVAGVPKAYPLARLPRRTEFEDRVGDVALRVAYDPSTRHLTVTRADTGEPVPHTYAYWFAWQAFYPTTDVWRK